MVSLAVFGSAKLKADSGTCGGATINLPFTDVMSSPFFCAIAEAYFSGLTNGTSPTTYSPSEIVLREQMAAFVTRGMDQGIRRGVRRAALQQFWNPLNIDGVSMTVVGDRPLLVDADGADLWVANQSSGTVSRVRASDGRLLDTWTDAVQATAVLSAKGLVFVTSETSPGNLYQIDPTQPAGSVTILSSSLGNMPISIAFDGSRVWTANNGGSISIVSLNPVSVTTISTGFSFPVGIMFDGTNMWVTDTGSPGKLLRLDSNGAIIQTVPVGDSPAYPVFDGRNIWVPNAVSSTISVVRAQTGQVMATLVNNGLDSPFTAAFDGERVLVTNTGSDTVSLWQATNLNPLGSANIGLNSPFGVCSDGVNFWITLSGSQKLARF